MNLFHICQGLYWLNIYTHLMDWLNIYTHLMDLVLHIWLHIQTWLEAIWTHCWYYWCVLCAHTFVCVCVTWGSVKVYFFTGLCMQDSWCQSFSASVQVSDVLLYSSFFKVRMHSLYLIPLSFNDSSPLCVLEKGFILNGLSILYK